MKVSECYDEGCEVHQSVTVRGVLAIRVFTVSGVKCTSVTVTGVGCPQVLSEQLGCIVVLQ